MKILVILLSYFIFYGQSTNAQNTITANQLWADQQCGGSSAYKKDEKKFNACVEKKMKSKETSTSGDLKKLELDAYIRGCKDALAQAKPDSDVKDIDMLCSDPYLNGTVNESKEDKSRRERLIKETDSDKKKFMQAAIGEKKESTSYDMSKNMSKDEYTSYLKNCKKALLESDSSKDPQDINMLCRNPYLYAPPDESYEDQMRRKRLLRETDSAKNKALDQKITPTKKDNSNSGTTK